MFYSNYQREAKMLTLQEKQGISDGIDIRWKFLRKFWWDLYENERSTFILDNRQISTKCFISVRFWQIPEENIYPLSSHFICWKKILLLLWIRDEYYDGFTTVLKFQRVSNENTTSVGNSSEMPETFILKYFSQSFIARNKKNLLLIMFMDV